MTASATLENYTTLTDVTSKSCLTSEDHAGLAVPQGNAGQITLFRRMGHRRVTTLVRSFVPSPNRECALRVQAV